jgi:hypothetical protein
MWLLPNYHWSFWILFLLGILFILWLFFSGGNHEFVGLSPLMPLVDNLEVEEVCPIVTSYEDPPSIDIVTIGDVEEKKTWQIYDDDHVPDVPPPQNPSRWKRQEACCRAAEEIFGVPFRRDVRDIPWLYNPETGARLELDCYNEELGVAIEHNGEHHYKFPNRFNKNKEEWIAMLRRDKLKPELCDKNGVYLVTIPYWVPFNKIKGEIRHQLEPLLKLVPKRFS